MMTEAFSTRASSGQRGRRTLPLVTILLLTLGLLVPNAPVAFAEPELIVVPPPEDPHGTKVFDVSRGPVAINDAGQVAGSFESDAEPWDGEQAFRWSEADGTVSLGTFGGSTRAFDMNEAGHVVGDSTVLADGRRTHRAYRWSPEQRLQDLGDPFESCTGVRSTYARAISDAGHVVGGGVCSDPWRAELLVWSADGQVTPVEVPAGVRAIPTGVNSKGEVVGSYDAGSDREGPFFWSAGRGFVPLHGDGYQDDNHFINERGEVAGLLNLEPPGPPVDGHRRIVGYFWDGSTMHLPFDGYGYSRVIDLNDEGQVLLRRSSSEHASDREDVIWSLTGPTVVLPTGFRSHALNDAGEVAGSFPDPDTGNEVAATWSDADGVRLLGVPGGVGYSTATVINSHGWVAGRYRRLRTDPPMVFVWLGGEQSSDPGDPDPADPGPGTPDDGDHEDRPWPDDPGTSPTPRCGDVEEMRFPDVRRGNPHAERIGCAGALELMQGYGDGTFGPERSLTRAQLASILARALRASGAELPPGTPVFDDVSGGTHAANIDALAAAGIVRGRTEDRFDPAAPVRRGQLVSMLVRAADRYPPALPPYDGTSTFSDVSGSVHEESIRRAERVRIVTGYEDGTFAPNRTVRRDQAASMVVRWWEWRAEGP
jgi:uncharacterized membrane protein